MMLAASGNRYTQLCKSSFELMLSVSGQHSHCECWLNIDSGGIARLQRLDVWLRPRFEQLDN